MNFKRIIFLILTLTLCGCIPFGKTKLKITTAIKNSTTNIKEMSISSVQINNHQLIINGNNLDSAIALKVSGNSFDESFTIESQSRSQIIANSIRAFSFDVSKVFSLIISDANASATFPIDFSICNSTLNGRAFNCSIGASDKDVLSYDAVTQTWKPRSATSGLNYLGSFDASSNPSNGPTPYPVAGAYYIIGQDGLVGATNYSVGDWMVSNGSAWQKIDNSTMVHSVFNRTGAIVAQEGDYELDQLLDVDLPGPITAGKVLKYDGSHWVAGDDLSSGGAGSVDTTALANGAVTDAKITSVSASKITGTINSTQILDGTIVNADINATAGIDYSKLNIPNTTIPYAKLNIASGDIAYAKLTVANGEIPVAKISGIPSVTTVLATTVVDGDLTHAPDGNAVYDSLALKLNMSGGSLTSAGTITNVPDPVGPLDVSNRQYTDTKLDKTSGGTVAGSLSLNTDLKLRGTTNYVTLKSTAATSAYTLTLPATAGTSGYVLSTDGSGVLSWVSAGGGPATGSLTTDQQAAVTIDPFGTSAGNTGEVRFKELVAGGTNYVALKSPDAIASNLVLVMPATAGSSGDVLTTNGSNPATLSWTTPTSGTGATLTGDIGGTVAANTIGSGKVTLTHLSATGTKDNTTYLRGDNTWAALGAGVLATPLSSLSLATGTAITASDTVLSGMGKLQKQISDIPAAASAPTGTADGTTYHAGDNTWKSFGSNVRAAVLTGLDATGIDYSSRTIASTDSALVAFNKILFTQGDYVSKSSNQTIYGSLKINSLTGFIEVPPPVNASEAANKGYVDSYGQWLKGTASNASDIYFSTGNVGVGTATPAAKLDVNGTIKIADSSVVCSASTAGAMRYNSTLAMVEECNGTFWNSKIGGALVPANVTVLMNACPSGWTSLGQIAGNGAVHCGTNACYQCQSPSSDVTLPASSIISVESCPRGWTKYATVTGAQTAAAVNNINYSACQAPPADTKLPGGLRLLMDICPANWKTIGRPAATGVQNSANCASGQCSSCEVPSDALISEMIVAAPSIESAEIGKSTGIIAGAGGTTSGNGGSVVINGGNSTSGNGGAITMSAGAGGTNGNGGTVTINSGNLAGTGTQGYVLINPNNANFVGIGTSIPSTKLDVTGVINASGGVTQVSDIRLKKNIQFLDSHDSLEKLLTLRGILYDWKDQKQYGKTRQLGLIAQDVQKVFPNAVRANLNGLLTLSYSSLIAPIIESLKEIKHWLVNHDEEIAALKSENRMMRSYLCSKDPEASFCK